MPCLDKIEHLVVDTSAFIKNIALQELGANIFTVQAVVDEILDKRQLRNLVVLPYDLKIKDAFPEDIKFITDFSKKTGDYPSLSATDIQVMALTYRLEKEKVGIDHLKTAPMANRVVSVTPHLDESYKGVAGFYLPPHEGKSEVAYKESSSEIPDKWGKSLGAVEKGSIKVQDNITLEQNSDDEEDPGEEGTLEQALMKGRPSPFALPRVTQQEEDGSISDIGSDSDDFDENDWITPSNIAQIKQELPLNEGNGGTIVVACITADFAMQNVLKQIGLQVLSVEGRVIQQLRTFILRCYSCFKTTSIMTKLFCPHCGNKTLKRVAVSLKEDGTQEIHLSAKKRITGRGKRFSLPKPQGGKHANNPILCEDQRIPHQRPSHLARIKNNPLDPDYIAGFSPFVMRDVTSRAAMLGIHSSEIKSWMRRNPNEVRKGRKKK